MPLTNRVQKVAPVLPYNARWSRIMRAGQIGLPIGSSLSNSLHLDWETLLDQGLIFS